MLKRCWAEEFFATGALQLSSFDEFRKHPDETRLDSQEGDLQLELVGSAADGTPEYTFMTAEYGRNAYVLCGSRSNDPSIAKAFDADGYIAIQETVPFAESVAQQIPGFIEGSEGPYDPIPPLRPQYTAIPVKQEQLGDRLRGLALAGLVEPRARDANSAPLGDELGGVSVEDREDRRRPGRPRHRGWRSGPVVVV
jgi:hypothetical protein